MTSPSESVEEAVAAKPERPTHLSPSGASAFEQCAKKWRWRYVDRLPDPPGEAAMVGTFAHRVLELLMQRAGPDRTKEAAKTIAAAEWPDVESDPDFMALDLTDEAIRGFKWKSWRAIDNLWKLEPPEYTEVQATEQHVEAVLAGVPFRGIVDRIDITDDGLVITDYKSGKAPSKRYESQRLPQVLLYAAAVAKSGTRPVRARLLFLGEPHAEVGVDVSDDNLEMVESALASTWDAIGTACEADEFPAGVGPLCGWCPYIELCSEGQAELHRRGKSVAGATRAVG